MQYVINGTVFAKKLFCFPGPSSKQCITCEVNRGRDCESYVCGCTKADGLDAVYKHAVVWSISDWSLSVFSASHHGLGNLCWLGRHGSIHASEYFDN